MRFDDAPLAEAGDPTDLGQVLTVVDDRDLHLARRRPLVAADGDTRDPARQPLDVGDPRVDGQQEGRRGGDEVDDPVGQVLVELGVEREDLLEVTELDDGLRIDPAPLRPSTFHTYADHRMVMAGAVLALRAPGTVIEDPATVGKTLPRFVDLWQGMLEASEG